MNETIERVFNIFVPVAKRLYILTNNDATTKKMCTSCSCVKRLSDRTQSFVANYENIWLLLQVSLDSYSYYEEIHNWTTLSK